MQTTTTPASRAARLVDRSRHHLSGARQRTRELGWLLFGRLAMTAANSILMLALPVLILDLATFGLFATAVGAQLLLSRLVLLGVDQGVIRLFTVEDRTDLPADVTRTGLSSSLRIAIPLLVVGLVAAAFDASALHALASPMILIAIVLGSTGTALFDYGYAEHLARLEYRAAALLQASMPAVRLVATIAVASIAAPDSHAAFLAYAVTALAFGAAQAARVGRRSGFRAPWASVGRLWRYSKWIGLADVAMILGLQQGLFLLGVLGNDQDAGVFGFSLTLGMGFFAVYLAFYQTILPRAARIASIDAVPRFLGKTYAMAIALVCVCIPLAWAIGAFLPVALEAWKPDKPELAEFAPSFYYYAAFTMFLVLEAPLAVTCHYLLRPQIQLAAMVIRCAAIGALGVWLVPAGGAVAAGQAQAGGAAIAFACLAAFVGLSLRSARRRSRCAAS